MRVQTVELEVVKGVYDGKAVDFDRYNIVGRTPMSTQEFSIQIDHIGKEITGDCIRYGSWGNLYNDEIEEMLVIINESGTLSRSYDSYKLGGYEND